MRSLALFLLFATPLGAQELGAVQAYPRAEDTPRTAVVSIRSVDGIEGSAPLRAVRSAPIHHFYDRYAKLELAGAGSLAVTDTVITCRFLARGQREMNLPIQSCGGMVGLQLGFYGAGEGLSFLLHKTGHHKLERLPRLYLGFGNAQGIVFSARHGGI
jgi:hypothetical protein